MGKEVGAVSENPNAHIERVRARVEEVLQSNFGVDNLGFPVDLLGQLSTIPFFVGPDVNKYSLNRKCVTFSVELGAKLINDGVKAKVVDSDKPFNPYVSIHTYVIVEESDQEVIVDPTIGQFLFGHNHVFVGSREQLKQLFYEYYQKGPSHYQGLYNTNLPEEYFEIFWGVVPKLRQEKKIASKSRF